MNRTALATLFAVTITVVAAPPSRAQAPLPAPAAPFYSPAELDRIVSPLNTGKHGEDAGQRRRSCGVKAHARYQRRAPTRL